jgi:hypothetical protein
MTFDLQLNSLMGVMPFSFYLTLLLLQTKLRNPNVTLNEENI